MSLFKDFNKVSSKEWKQKIQMDLKGADYNNTLIKTTNEGIHIKPFYHKDDFKSIAINLTKIDFNIAQSVFIADEKIANKIAQNALKKGAKSIHFLANSEFNIDLILNNLNTYKAINICFKINFINQDFINDLLEKTNDLSIDLEIDIIENFVKTGNWYQDRVNDFEQLKKSVKKTNCISVNTGIYQNAGANQVQQIAYALAHLNEYLNDNIINNNTKINCNFTVGGDYFFEIAKLRAFRYLFQKLIKEYNISPTLNIIVQPTLRNKTIYDYNCNMLRTTTECMSAILGGANEISNVSYDSIYHKSNDFGERIARNQLIILKEESYFKEANQIVEGSYYIEQITYELAEKSLILFKNIEKNNGFINQLLKGTIQRKIEESALKEQTQFDNNELTLVGTNKYQNVNDKMKKDLELFPFLKKKSRKTIIKPIIPKRLSENIEQERLKKE